MLKVFNNISLDGFFCDANNDMSWAHNDDEEWREWTNRNASGDGVLVFGRVTYDMMAQFWPTPAAAQAMPTVAKRMNAAKKIVFSRTMQRADWQNTEIVSGEIAKAMQQKKAETAADFVVMGSGTIVAQLTDAGVIDEYQLVVHPIVLGSGRSLFTGVARPISLQLASERRFGNGNVVLTYRAAS